MTFYDRQEWTNEQIVKFCKLADEKITDLQRDLETLAVELDRLSKFVERDRG